MKYVWRAAYLLLAVAVILAIGYGFLPKPVLVETGKVSRGPLAVTFIEEGKTRVRDRFVISAPVTGYAPRLPFKIGDEIRKGQAIITISPLPSNALDPRSLAQAQAQIAVAQASQKTAEEQSRITAADLSYAETELARARQLHESGVIPREQLDRAETEARRAQASHQAALLAIEVANREIEAARAALDYSTSSASNSDGRPVAVTSPVQGRVLKVVRESESVVNAGQSLLEIGDAHALEVEVEVLSADAVQVSPGTKVILERWGGNELLEGRVRLIEPVGFTKISALGVEEQLVLVIVELVTDSKVWERLADGYRVEARFVLWEGEDVMQVPSSALFRLGEEWAVFTISDGKAQRKTVKIDRQGGLTTEILEGISEGESVILHPDRTMEDGTLVELRVP